MVDPDRAKVVSRNYYMANKEKSLQKTKKYYRENKEHMHVLARNGYLRNREARLAREKERRLANPELFKEKSRKYRARYPHRAAANVRRYQVRKLHATPKWANKFFIDEIYDLAVLRTKYLGIKHEVDHIVPLRSPLVCGLHVEHNLQVIPRSVNIEKGNRTWPGKP